MLSETSKNVMVDPPSSVPYWMTFCLARSSADSIGEIMRSRYIDGQVSVCLCGCRWVMSCGDDSDRQLSVCLCGCV